MTQSLVVAAEQRQADRGQAAAVGEAEGRATLALLRQFRHDDWQRRTDATEWDVRTLVSHLVAQAARSPTCAPCPAATTTSSWNSSPVTQPS